MHKMVEIAYFKRDTKRTRLSHKQNDRFQMRYKAGEVFSHQITHIADFNRYKACEVLSYKK